MPDPHTLTDEQLRMLTAGEREIAERAAKHPVWDDLARNEIPTLLRTVAGLREEQDALLKFKQWVHAFLDSVGVPHDPDPEGNRQHGCRIGGRMRWLMAERERMRAAMKDARAFIGVMFGQGPDSIIPETVDTPLKIPVKIGEITRDMDAALAAPSPATRAGEGVDR